VTPAGHTPFGDEPDDPFEARDSAGSGDDHLDDLFDDHVVGGWIDPTDRPWRHPSELSSGFSTGQQTGELPGFVHSRRRMAAMDLVGTAAAAAVVVGVVALNTFTPNGHPLPVATPLQTNTVTTAAFTSQGQAGAERTAVKLISTTKNKTMVGVGVVVAKGGYVATTTDLVRGASSIMMATATGNVRASVIAMDPTSHIALLQVPLDPPVAQFEDDSSLSRGAKTTVLTVSSTPTIDQWQLSTGTIESVGSAPDVNGASEMADIVAADPDASPLPGAPLMNANGAVIGILDVTATRSGSERTFLPAGLVLGVTNDLATWGIVRHGWLGVEGADASLDRGAVVESVDPDGASARELKAGDVIEGIGGDRIRSMTELRSRLYALTPGTLVHLNIIRGSIPMTVDVDLASSP
jgi:S1-C subfamily serine protease